MRQFPGYGLLVDSAPMVFLRRAVVPSSIRSFVRSQLTMKQRPILNAAVRERLEDSFNGDLRVLSEWLGVDLDCGNFHDETAGGELDWTE
jgi:hypothetical protein